MLSPWFSVLFLCFGFSWAAFDDYLPAQPTLDAGEKAAVCQILAAINPEMDWSYTSAVDLCTEGPHGIVCLVDEEDPTLAHVVELNLGYVSDYSNNPACSAANASFTPAITLLPYLSKLFFYRCFTAGNPVSFPDYLWTLGPQLQELVFHSNPSLAGPLPDELGNLTGLRRLIVSGNSVSGNVPASIGGLRNLQQLDLSNNALTGSVPSAIAWLRELVVVDLSRNVLCGSIPSELGLLPKLSKLDLSYNNLTGRLPAAIASAKSLEMLDLSWNRLTGGVPPVLGSLRSLKTLHMAGNPMGGTLPDIWKGLKGLVGLDLSRTGLVGLIPASMGELKELSYMALDHNNLSGPVPATLAELPSIHHIDLSHNRLSGLVPFSTVMVGKLGDRLKLNANQELCVNPETLVASLAEKIGLADCRYTLSSSSKSSADLAESLQKDGTSYGVHVHHYWIGYQATSLLVGLFYLGFH